MNLFFRLIWFLSTARFRSPCDLLGPCRTPFRVLPTDLDVLRHVNNGVYLSLLDLARVDLMVRSGLWAALNTRGWYPVVTAETIRFRRSLKLFERFDIETRVIGWDKKAFLVQHRFMRAGNEVAHAVVRARFLKRSGGSVHTQDVLDLGGVSGPPPMLPTWVERWNEDQAAPRHAPA